MWIFRETHTGKEHSELQPSRNSRVKVPGLGGQSVDTSIFTASLSSLSPTSRFLWRPVTQDNASHRILNSWIPRWFWNGNKDNLVRQRICAPGWMARCSFNWTVRLISSWPLGGSWSCGQLVYLQSCIPTSFSDSQISFIPSTSSGMCIPTVSDSSSWIGAFWNCGSWARRGRDWEVAGYWTFSKGTLLPSQWPLVPEYPLTFTPMRGRHWSNWGWHYEHSSFNI